MIPFRHRAKGDVGWTERAAGGSNTGVKILAVVIAAAALAVAATTGDSWAVRSILVLVAGDVAVRLMMVTRRRIDAAALAGGLAVLALGDSGLERSGRRARASRLRGDQRAAGRARAGDAGRPVPRCARDRPLVASIALVARRPRLAVAALLVTLGKLLAERLVWKVVQRNRPGETEPEAIVRGDTNPTGVSFVSGHVVLTTGLAWVATPTCTAGGGSCRG